MYREFSSVAEVREAALVDGLEVDCVSSLSGGIDSTVLGYHLVKEYDHAPLFVYVEYGSRATTGELEAARETCRRLDRPLLILSLREYRQFNPSYLVGSTESAPKDLQFWSEGRNAFLGLVLASVASALDCYYVYMGMNYSDANDGYVDTDKPFVFAFNLLLAHSFRNKVELSCPYIEEELTKKEILELGESYGIDWSAQTYSCSSTGGHPCCHYSECESCKWRLIAFNSINRPDPFNKYMVPIDQMVLASRLLEEFENGNG